MSERPLVTCQFLTREPHPLNQHCDQARVTHAEVAAGWFADASALTDLSHALDPTGALDAAISDARRLSGTKGGQTDD